MKTPDYVLSEDFKKLDANWEAKIIPAGTFVRPIDERYVPDHVKKDRLNMLMRTEHDVYCYTPMGIILIPFAIIRRV